MDPLASIAVDQSAWFGFGVPVLVTFAVAGAAIAVGGVLFVVWEWRKLVRSVTPRFRRARHAR